MRLLLLLLLAGRAAACPPHLAGRWGPDACVFANKMVLASSDAWQAGSTPARVWGSGAAPGAPIALRGLPAAATVTPGNPWRADALGNWSIEIGVLASLTSYNLTFSSTGTATNQAVTLTDVLFGHTVLCSGRTSQPPSALRPPPSVLLACAQLPEDFISLSAA